MVIIMDSNRNKLYRRKVTSDEAAYEAQPMLMDQISQSWTFRSSAIAKRVLEALKVKKMMQKELAMTIGFRPQQVSRILRGNVNLTIKTIAKLEAALGIRLIEVPADSVRARRRTRPKSSMES